MITIKILSILMVLVGAICLSQSFAPSRKIWEEVSGPLRRKWLIIMYLIGFFLLGYVFFDIVLISNLHFPVELVTAGVFLGGAVFVYLIINISQSTIAERQKAEEEINVLNESLEKRVADRTQALRESEENNRQLLQAAGDGIFGVNTKGQVTFVNPAALSMLGFAAEEMLGQSVHQLIHHSHKDGSNYPLEDCPMYSSYTNATANNVIDELLWRKDGSNFPVEYSSRPVIKDGKVSGAVVIFKDVTTRKQAEEKIWQLAYHDALTGLPNRKLFSDRLGLALAQAQRSRKEVGIAMLDLDNFKEVNDTLGHDVGDLLLKATAERLSASLRKGDTVARFGGDEFVLILPDLKGLEDTNQVAQKILDSFHKPFITDTHHLKLTMSIGINVYPKDGADEVILLRNADKAMYQAKQSGGNQYKLHKKT